MTTTSLTPDLFLKTLPFMNRGDLQKTLTIAKDFTPSIIRTYQKTERDPFFLFVDATDKQFSEDLTFFTESNSQESLYENLQKRFSPGFALAPERTKSFDYTNGLDKTPENNPLILIIRKQKKLESYEKNLGAFIAILQQIFRIVKIMEIDNKVTESIKVYKLARKYTTAEFQPYTCICDTFATLITRKDGNWFGRIPLCNVKELYSLSTGRIFIKKGTKSSVKKGRFVPY